MESFFRQIGPKGVRLLSFGLGSSDPVDRRFRTGRQADPDSRELGDSSPLRPVLACGAFSGFWIARLFGLSTGERRTLSIEVGMQNSGLGTSLATDYFGKTSMVAAPCALSAVMHCLIGGLLAIRWRRNSDPEE